MSNRSLNKVMLLGNLAAEPEYKILNSNTTVATVSMATNESYKDAQGNTQDKTEWHKLVFWSKLADVVHQYLHKGSQVYVEGKLRTRDYTDQNGQKKYVTEIQVTELIMLGGAQQTQPQGQYPQQQPSRDTQVSTLNSSHILKDNSIISTINNSHILSRDMVSNRDNLSRGTCHLLRICRDNDDNPLYSMQGIRRLYEIFTHRKEKDN